MINIFALFLIFLRNRNCGLNSLNFMIWHLLNLFHIVNKMCLVKSSLSELLTRKLKEKNGDNNYNSGLESLFQIDRLLYGMGQLLPEVIDTNIIPKFTYCPVTSVDVKRSFCDLKTLERCQYEQFWGYCVAMANSFL